MIDALQIRYREVPQALGWMAVARCPICESFYEKGGHGPLTAVSGSQKQCKALIRRKFRKAHPEACGK